MSKLNVTLPKLKVKKLMMEQKKRNNSLTKYHKKKITSPIKRSAIISTQFYAKPRLCNYVSKSNGCQLKIIEQTNDLHADNKEATDKKETSVKLEKANKTAEEESNVLELFRNKNVIDLELPNVKPDQQISIALQKLDSVELRLDEMLKSVQGSIDQYNSNKAKSKELYNK